MGLSGFAGPRSEIAATRHRIVPVTYFGHLARDMAVVWVFRTRDMAKDDHAMEDLFKRVRQFRLT